jgi:hypothetical protein
VDLAIVKSADVTLPFSSISPSILSTAFHHLEPPMHFARFRRRLLQGKPLAVYRSSKCDPSFGVPWPA